MRTTMVACLFAVLMSGVTAGQETAVQAEDILKTILLPRVSEILREKGIPAADVEEAVLGARRRGVPAAETSVILEETITSVDARGPIDNFGAFVQEQLDRGLRGRDLAAAIREEHVRRGIGKGKKIPGKSRGDGPGMREGKPGRAPSEKADTIESRRRRTPGEPGARPPDTTLTGRPRGAVPQGGTHEE